MPSPNDSSRILLILDLDETLIYATETPLDRPADFRAYQFHVYMRPHLHSFLEVCATHFDLAVWSSASDEYVSVICSKIFNETHDLKFIWGRSRASLRRLITDDGYFGDYSNHMHYRKPLAKLKKLGFALERMVILDDTPAKSQQNFGNAIYPRPWEGEPVDKELVFLAAYLPNLAQCENVRKIEKRNWRMHPHVTALDV